MIWSQIATIVFSIGYAFQQAAAVKMFWDYLPINNPYVNKYHRGGAFVALAFIVGVSGFSWLIVLNCFWYWLAFDIALNKFTGRSWDYVGHTSKVDKWLHSLTLHDDAGEMKATFCVGAIIFLNIILSGKYIG
jgi:hypothetical protein